MKHHALISIVGSVFRAFVLGDVSNEGDAPDNVVLKIAEGRVVASEKAFATRFGNGVRSVFRNCAFATQRGKETFVLAGFSEEGKNVERVFAEDLFGRYTGDTLHRLIPDGVAATAIKREYAVDAGVEQALEEQVILSRLVQELFRYQALELRIVGMVLIVAHIQ